MTKHFVYLVVHKRTRKLLLEQAFDSNLRAAHYSHNLKNFEILEVRVVK